MAYILGLMEADGSFLLFFGTGKSKTTLKPCIRISQKTNNNILGLIASWFTEQGIEYKKENWNEKTSKGRAPNLAITKVESVRKFIDLVKKEPFQFISQKQRDFLILDRVINTPKPLSISDKVNLKKSMHKANMNQPDLDHSGAKTRAKLEKDYKIPSGTSRDDLLGILAGIDANYAAHVERIQELVKEGNFSIPPDWLAGLIDGDGSYYVPIEPEGKSFIEFQGDFTITMEKNALLTLQAVRAALKSDAEIEEKKEHYQLWIRKQAEVESLLQMQRAFLPVGNHRLAQYELVTELLAFKKAGKMRDLNTVLSIIEKAYKISEKSKGRERSKTKEEMMKIAREIYS